MKLAVTGYYGAGNLGDEAFVYVLKRGLKDFVPAIWPEYPPGVTHVVVGGGEYENWMVPKRDMAHFGVGLGLSRDRVGSERAEVLRTFRFLAVRTLASLRLAEAHGLPAVLGADLAYLLNPTSCDFDVRNRAVLVLPPGMPPAASGYSPDHAVVVPFHPSCDPGDCGYDVYRNFDDPNRPALVLDILRRSCHVFCWGTLHAAVFAEQAGVPWTSLAVNPKITAHVEMVRTFGLQDRRLLAASSLQGLRAALVCS